MTGLSEPLNLLDEQVQRSVAGGPVERSLRPGQLRFARTIALSVGIQGPVAGVIVGPAVLAGIVGGSGALAYLLGLVAMGFVAYAFVIFSRSFNSAGSIYAFNGAALGPAYGFLSAWILLLVYVSFAGGVYTSTADIAQSLFASFGVHAWWVWFALAGFTLTMILAYFSIGFSSVVILACEGIAVLLLAVVGVVVLTKGGGGHHSAISAAPFEWHGITVGVLGLGVVNAFGAFSGFEGAATLGEESHRPARAIPAAITGSLVGAALIYIGFTWIADNAYPNAAALAAAPAPFVHLATIDIGSSMGKAVNAAGVISAFGAQLACINAANRLGVCPGPRHRRHRPRPSPHPHRPAVCFTDRSAGGDRRGQPGRSTRLQLRGHRHPGTDDHCRVRCVPDHRRLPADGDGGHRVGLAP
jgi:amino acid transporter